MTARRSAWLSALTYLVVAGATFFVGYAWYGLRWDGAVLALVILAAWLLWLTIDRSNVLDYAEQAADRADETAGQLDVVAEHHDRLVASFNDLRDWVEEWYNATMGEPDTTPIPIKQPPTVPMAQAWDTSAAQLTKPAEPETRLHTRQFSGHSFQFRDTLTPGE